mgnify:CR=1 FL=1
MAKADLDHPALEKVPFYEARLIHRKDIHTASDHSAGLFLRYYKQQHWHLHHGYSWLLKISVLHKLKKAFAVLHPLF